MKQFILGVMSLLGLGFALCGVAVAIEGSGVLGLIMIAAGLFLVFRGFKND